MDGSNLIKCFIRDHTHQAARVLENRSLDELVPFFDRIPAELAALLLNTMEPHTAGSCLERMTADRAAGALDRVPLERAALLMRRLLPETREAVLQLLPPEPNRHLGLLMRGREDTAGALMEPRIFTLPTEVSAGEALSRVRSNPERASHYLYVLERDQTLAGVLTLRELLAAGEDSEIASLMQRDVVCLRMGDSLASVLVHPAWLEFHTLPVIDENNQFTGALRHKTLRQLANRVQGPVRLDHAGLALGELFRIGLSGLVNSALAVEDTPRIESLPQVQRPLPP